jgi:hypothetical protein
MIKNVCGSSPLLAALGSLASVFLLASPAKGAAIAVDYVTSYSNLYSGGELVSYNSINGLAQFLSANPGGTTVTLTTVASTPSTNVLGLTAASTALAGMQFNPQTGRTSTASASSYANLATGMIGAGAAGSVQSGTTIAGGVAFAGAEMEDTITFNNTSGHTVNIDVFWTFDGTMPIATTGESIDNLFCLAAGASCLGNSNPGTGVLNGPPNGGQFFRLEDNFSLGLPTDPFITEPTTGWVSSSFTPSINADSGTFHGVFAVPSGISMDSLNAYFDIKCLEATCDFTHTGALSFGGLDGVSFTSGSGVLLTQSGAAAPEPGSWILMMAGLGLIGLAKLRTPYRRCCVTGTEQAITPALRRPAILPGCCGAVR